MPGKIPTDSQRKIIDNIFRKYLEINNNTLSLADFSDDILTELLTANLYQSLKTDLQRTEKILTEENKNYFTFLIDSQDKTIVDEPTLNNCKSGVEALKSNEEVRSLLQLDKSEEDVHIESYSELPIEVDVEHLPFGFKGILDNIIIDKESKTIFINDLKTTGKPLVDFPESVQYYKYWVQAMVYVKLTYDKFLKDLPDLNEWNLYFTFIVIDKYNQVYPFQVSMETMTIWQQDFEELTDILKYHYEKKDFKLPYELAKGNVKL